MALDGSFVRNARGMPVSLRGTVRDITQRKKAEQELAERNLQLALAGKAALVGSYAYDVRTDQMEVSEGYAVIHGLPEGRPKRRAVNGRSGCILRMSESSTIFDASHSSVDAASTTPIIARSFLVGVCAGSDHAASFPIMAMGNQNV